MERVTVRARVDAHDYPISVLVKHLRARREQCAAG